MITRKIRSLKDQTLRTVVDRKLLVQGEVTTMNFVNEPQMLSFVDIGVLELVSDREPEKKSIPVIGTRKPIDDVAKREIEIPITFLRDFNVADHLRNGI